MHERDTGKGFAMVPQVNACACLTSGPPLCAGHHEEQDAHTQVEPVPNRHQHRPLHASQRHAHGCLRPIVWDHSGMQSHPVQPVRDVQDVVTKHIPNWTELLNVGPPCHIWSPTKVQPLTPLHAARTVCWSALMFSGCLVAPAYNLGIISVRGWSVNVCLRVQPSRIVII